MEDLFNNLINDIEKKESEIFTDLEDLDVTQEKYEGIVEGWQNAMEIVKSLILENKNFILGQVNYRQYISFILGYDLLNTQFKNSDRPECDMVFEECKNLTKEFLESEHDISTKGLYECLEDFVENKLKNI